MTSPSNSPSTPASSHAKSDRPRNSPSAPSTSNCWVGDGTPWRCISTRLRDSPTLSLSGDANPATARAIAAPRRRRTWSAALINPAWSTSPAHNAASATTTPCSKVADRARSINVRATEVTRWPPTVVTSVGSRGAT
ncbi:hypothetical protein D1871_08985 [Nakamurella silvestris]|nr:hypothetical protein D1871_08985 [Nakamurella silvestris]